MRRRVLLGVFALALAPCRARAQDDAPPPAEVEVHAPALSPASAPRDAAVAGSTVRRAELEKPRLTASEVLRTQVGTTITETGGLGAPATASIRGATAAETPVYLGGVRVNDDVAGAADLSTLPLWLVDRVELYRGNAPFEADRYGIGGALFFEPLRPHDTSIAFGTTIGSYGSQGAFAYGTIGNRDRGLLVGASFTSAKNDYEFTNQSGERERWQNADAQLVDVWLLGRTKVGSGSVDVLVNHFDREQGAVRFASVQTYEARQHLDRTLGAVTGRAPLGSHAGLELRSSALVAGSTLDDPKQEILPTLRAPGTKLEQQGERFEQEIAARADFGTKTHARLAVLGASERLRRYENAQIANVAPALDALRMTGRVAAALEQDLAPWVSLRGLFAVECHSTSTTGAFGICNQAEPVGRLGALFRASELTGFVAAGRYSRPPTLGELYGTSLAVQGNAALEAESGVTLDAGARYSHTLAGQQRPLYAALSGYARRSTNLVTFVRASQDYVTPENVNSANVYGLELEAGSGFLSYFSADFGLTLLDFRDRTEGRTVANDILPYHSRLVVAPGLGAYSPDLENRYLSRATFGARLVYQSNRYADFAGLSVIPAQTSIDLDAALECFDKVVWLRARVTDVFDAARYDVVGFPLPGRSVFFSLDMKTGPL